MKSSLGKDLTKSNIEMVLHQPLRLFFPTFQFLMAETLKEESKPRNVKIDHAIHLKFQNFLDKSQDLLYFTALSEAIGINFKTKDLLVYCC